MSADKSAEQLATLEEYSYLKPLLRIRQFLSNIEKDWSRRNLVGRTQYSGFSRLRPDVFDFDTCKTLYAALITADMDEEERAYQVALKIENGELPDTETNRHLAKPQFRHVTPKDVITVEWLWSLHTFNSRTYEAVHIYDSIWNGHETYTERLLDHEPGKSVKIPSTPQPQGFYLYCGERSDDPNVYLTENWFTTQNEEWSNCNGFNILGLRDICGEFAEVSRPHRVYKERKNGEDFDDLMCDFNVSDSFEVDEELANEIMAYPDCYLNYQASRGLYLPQTAAMKFLKIGVISIGKGKEPIYQSMAKRAQYYAARKLTGGLSWSDIESVKQRDDLQLLTPEQFKSHQSRLVELYQQLCCISVVALSDEFVNAANLETFDVSLIDLIYVFYQLADIPEHGEFDIEKVYQHQLIGVKSAALKVKLSNPNRYVEDKLKLLFSTISPTSNFIPENKILEKGVKELLKVGKSLVDQLTFKSKETQLSVKATVFITDAKGRKYEQTELF